MKRTPDIEYRDKFGPLDAYEKLLHPATMEALERGSKYYQTTWLEHMHENMNTLQNVRHVIDIHAETRINQALERLDYKDFEGFLKYMGSAVGYLANAVLKAKYLLDKETEETE